MKKLIFATIIALSCVSLVGAWVIQHSLGAPAGPPSGYSLVSNANAASSGGASVTTSGIDSTGGSLIVLVLSSYQAVSPGHPTISDSKGNVWTSTTAYNKVNPRAAIYYASNPIVGTGHTFTATNNPSAAYSVVSVSVWSGSLTGSDPLDRVAGASSGASTSITLSGSVTPSVDNCLIISGMTGTVSNTMGIDSSFTVISQNNYSAGNNMGGAHAYLVQGTAAAFNPTWSWTNSMTSAMIVAVFKPAT